MATYTRAELRNAVLQELGVVDLQSDPSPSDAKLADERCQQQLELLYDEGYIPFDLDSAIPARYFIPLVSIIAYRLVLPYGAMSRMQALTINARGAMTSLAALKNHRYMGTPLRAEYF